MTSFIEKYLFLRKEVEKFGKNIRIVVVTKYIKEDYIFFELSKAGVKEIAESYAQELKKKYDYAKQFSFYWHFVGHLQKNKTKIVVPICDYIQSLDSLDLAQKINEYSKKMNKIQNCLLELKVSQEDTKFGIKEEDIYKVLENIISLRLENIEIVGIMTMAPYSDNLEEVRPYFKKAYRIFSSIKKTYSELKSFDILSMGMSNDYKVALEEGANMLRIGSLLFNNEYKVN
ncbi:MAG: YggS family pyridoxal phosphate-dependent enzyme [Endomicrobia bacterium]|nr:YggS family pyridoxal phosphate-dependent enzyme [Endomicrobiia bacterium]